MRYYELFHHEFYGDDAVGLAYNGSLMDVIVSLGSDPGIGFDVAGTFNVTNNHTLVRKANVISGNIDCSISAGTNSDDSECSILDINDLSNLGAYICTTFGENTTICNDSSACNIDEENECISPNTGHDCDGNCLSDVDCMGVCGGLTSVDECGVCNGLGAIYECGCANIQVGNVTVMGVYGTETEIVVVVPS